MFNIATKITQDQFEKEIFNLVGNEYTVLGEYINSRTKIKLRHNEEKCNFYTWDVTPSHFINDNSRCPMCYGNIKKSNDAVRQEIHNLSNGEFELVGNYINADTPIILRHNNITCNNYEFKTIISNFKKSLKCPKCNGQVKRKSTEYFKQEVYEKVKDEFEVLGEYENNKKKILMKHNNINCNYYTWGVTPDSFLRNTGCPKCAGVVKKTNDDFLKEIYDLVANEYEVLGQYKNSTTKVIIKHNICNNEYTVTPHDFLSGRRCPFCNESKGEQTIRKFLQNNNQYFISQYTFDNCKRKEKLPFDFAVFEDESKTLLKYLIEYDGEFHYRPMIGEKHLRYQKYNDNLKNEYCRNNNIKLIRIPYWDFDKIEEILSKYI